MASSSKYSHQYPLVKLPHPFLTTYQVRTVAETTPAKLNLALHDQSLAGRPFPQPLHLDSLTWLDLRFRKDDCPPLNNNSAWARARRSPHTTFQWAENSAPSLGQIWNVVHAIYLAHPTYESFRLSLVGAEKEIIRSELLSTGLAIEHPKPWRPADNPNFHSGELLVLRSSFWQGAASPTGPRPIWVAGDGTDGPLRAPLSQYPIMPENYEVTMKFPDEPVYARHPTRRPKPHPGSIVYSRYIPEVDEHFSLEAVDWQNAEHLQLFNTWQNDPRVAKGWNETGTLDQHREYLRRLHFDPHVLCLFGRFNDSRFSYYELYWAKVKLPSHLLSASLLSLTPCPTGRPLRLPLRSPRLRPRPPLPRRRRLLPRRAARQRVVLGLHPLLLPRRPAHRKCRRRAARHGLHHPLVRELAGPRHRKVRRPRPQAVRAFDLQPREVVPAVSGVLGWAGSAVGVGGSRRVECEALGRRCLCRLVFLNPYDLFEFNELFPLDTSEITSDCSSLCRLFFSLICSCCQKYTANTIYFFLLRSLFRSAGHNSLLDFPLSKA